jgi:diadenylate cyclase
VRNCPSPFFQRAKFTHAVYAVNNCILRASLPIQHRSVNTMNKAFLILHDLLSWRGILDILLIALVFFYLNRTLVRLGTWKILAGIFLAFLLYAVASLLELEGIEWIFQNISQVAVLALIVIFQPELRKIFEKVVSFYNKQSQQLNQQTVTSIAETLWKLAGQRRGAIIVFPGKEPIVEKLSGGYTLGADISGPLILSIFDPHSPGHDGAIIVEKGKLTRFGVRLPMSQTDRLSSEYGTRHHAAMGLAETTDALILVVSEERGQVSAFVNGTMSKLHTLQTILDLISYHLDKYGTFELGGIDGYDRRTGIQAACCLIAATILWIFLASGNRQVIEQALSLPITYSTPAANLMLVSEQPDEVKVLLAGPKSSFDEFVLTHPVVNIDLSTMVEGKQTILIGTDNLKIPDKLSFLGSTPSQIEVQLAKMVQKEVPIMPQLVGELPAHLKIHKITVSPEKILVLTPAASAKKKTIAVSTTPIYLNSIRETTQVFGKVLTPPNVHPVDKHQQDIEINIEIEKTN